MGAAAQSDGAGDEQADRGEQHRAPAMDVGKLAVERRHRRRGQEIGGDDPRQALEIGEMAADGRKRRGDDGLVQRREERRQHQSEEDGADFGMAHRRRPVGDGIAASGAPALSATVLPTMQLGLVRLAAESPSTFSPLAAPSPRTPARTLERARAAAREKFIAAKNPTTHELNRVAPQNH